MASPTPPIDRRILRTRKMLWTALIELIQEKEYAEITIQDIADRANVNRVTFYLHYHDKQDLLEHGVEDIFNDLASKTAPFIGKNFRMDVPPEGLVLVYRYIAENAKFYRIVLGKNGIPFVIDRLRKYLAELTIQRFQPIASSKKGRVPLEVVAQHAAGSVIGLVTWWLENDMPILPEEFAHQTLLLTAYGAYWGAGIDPPEVASP